MEEKQKNYKSGGKTALCYISISTMEDLPKEVGYESKEEWQE